MSIRLAGLRYRVLSRMIERRSTMRYGLATIVLAIAALTGTGTISRADTPAFAPCDADLPETPYPPVAAPPTIHVWTQPSEAATAADASCFGSSESNFRMLVSVAGSFENPIGPGNILARFGMVSKLMSVRYWSTTDKQWRPLVLAATALTAKNSGQPREDFSIAELRGGQDVYFSQKDSRGAGVVIYRMRARESGTGRLIMETENVTPVRWFGMTLLQPGGLRASYYFREGSRGTWTYLGITRIAESSWLIAGHDNSYTNRVVALYRHIVGIPTDLEPPAAP